MARPKGEINVKRGKRLKTLCEEMKITQTKLSDLTGISQQAISNMIQGKANVTETTARAVVEQFPMYRFEWLMDIDDYATEPEKRAGEYQKIAGLINDEMKGFDYLARRHGYSFIVDDTKSKNVDDPTAVTVFRYGKPVATCSYKAYFDIAEDIKDYAAFKLARFMNQKAHKKTEDK